MLKVIDNDYALRQNSNTLTTKNYANHPSTTTINSARGQKKEIADLAKPGPGSLSGKNNRSTS